MSRRNSTIRSSSYASSGINLEQSPWRALAVPYLSIMLCSLLPVLILADVMPLVPPLGYLMLVTWRIMRPGLLPMWVGIPLGLFDDLFSGQPIGSAILLWSLTMIALELIETRFPWRGFWQDWVTASVAVTLYILLSMAISGADISRHLLIALVPQLLLSALLYPIFSPMVARMDRFRLARARRVG